MCVFTKTKYLFLLTENQKSKMRRDNEIVSGYLKALKERAGQAWIREMQSKYGLSHASVSSIIKRKRNLI